MKKLLYIILILFLFTNVINIFIPVFAEESSSAEVSFCDRDGWVSMVDGYSGGQFNFSRLQQYPQPFVNENGRTMFPILYFDEIFRDGLSYDINDNTITITRNILDVITTVSVTIDSNVLIRNGEEIVTLALGGHRPGGAAQIQVHLGIAQRPQLTDHPRNRSFFF